MSRSIQTKLTLSAEKAGPDGAYIMCAWAQASQEQTPSMWPTAPQVWMKIEVGHRAEYERTFTSMDVESFAKLSGDRGTHHIRPDNKGRVMVQGLLTATVPTKLGGDLNYIAREMAFRFVRPVFVGDTVRCEAVVTKAEPGEGCTNLSIDIVCRNQRGEEVLLGNTNGLIRL
jgi:3-hydroxybutyryl-CoA dehydratase